MSVSVEVIETEDAGVFPDWPMWLRCDRCGHGHLPYYAAQSDYDLHVNVHKHAADTVRNHARSAGWDAPGFGGFDVCPPCQEIIESSARVGVGVTAQNERS